MHTFSQPSYFTSGPHRIFLEYTPCMLSHPGLLIILLHGLGGSSNSFQPLVSDLSISHPVLRIDWPGHGRSSLHGELQFEDLVLLLHEIIAHVSPDAPVILVGHSVGSTVAMHYVNRFPANVKALAAIGPLGKRKPGGAEHMHRLAATARKGIEFMTDTAVENNVSPHSSEVVRAFVREVIAGQNGEGYATMCEVMAGLDSEPNYSHIACPTVVISGLDDRISSLETGKEVAASIAGCGSDQTVVVNSGHQHVLEDAEGVLKAIRGLIVKAR